MLESIGWIATALFGASYLFKAPNTLRIIQAIAAVLWIGYGLVIHAYPVVVSNAIVAVMALFSAWSQRKEAVVIVPETPTREKMMASSGNVH